MGLLEEIRKAKRVYLCGNGGSAANAAHIANDLVSVGVRAQALTTDLSTLTAIGNDYGFERVFARQLAALGDASDLLVAFSGSGDSSNIVLALATARAMGMRTYAVVGDFNKKPIAILSGLSMGHERYGTTMQEAEEYQLILGHSIMRKIRDHEDI